MQPTECDFRLERGLPPHPFEARRGWPKKWLPLVVTMPLTQGTQGGFGEDTHIFDYLSGRNDESALQ
jgi:hypothetical protein